MKFPLLLAATLLTSACSPAASSDAPTDTQATAQAKPGKKDKKHHAKADLPNGLREVGRVDKEIQEGSGLCPAPQPGTYFTFGDQGNPATVYRISGTGELLGRLNIGAENRDWESLTRDNGGNYYLGDCGNNAFERRDLALLRFRPDNPGQVGRINFKYADQTEFPPEKKKDSNFDCEATLWHDNQVWLFTKDPKDQTCKVYTVPDQPGTYVAKLVTTIALPGRVTDAALAPDGRRLVLLAREELFVLEGTSWPAILQATPRRIGLDGAGQTEGVAFKDGNTLLISTEQGRLYELGL